MRDLSSALSSIAGPSVVFRELWQSFLPAVPERRLEETWKCFAMSGATSFVSALCKVSSNYISDIHLLRLNAEEADFRQLNN